MTVSNGSQITAADLNALTTASLALLQADNARVPGGVPLVFSFQGGINTTAAHRRRAIIVVPFDLLIETVAVQTGEHSVGASTTVAITGDGALPSFPITVTGVTGTGRQAIPRLLYDGTKTNQAKDFATTSRAVRVWPKGSTITVQVTTTNTTALSTICVVIVGRAFYARETG